MRALIAIAAWIVLLVMVAGSVLGGEAVILMHGPRVVDGDTLAIDRPGTGVVLYVRLWGIAAPELDQPGGADARDVLASEIAGHMLICEPAARPSYGRIVARCRADGRDIAELLARRGVARDCPAYSGGAYAGAEDEAAKALSIPPYCDAGGAR